MQYISVFTLFAFPVAKGFPSLQQATDYLSKADNDQDIAPLGIYDAVMGVVIPYKGEEYSLLNMEERMIARLAKKHLERVA
ncbi:MULTISPECIES: hypothetical protein [Spirosoma]|uniref:Nonstructural protein n=1 Tax=Spirosoma liriopis TaxID=2937440 RepID=A0ABT0HET5_9BACT|nr:MULTISPECIES: hypothetical protein [Spirosoma]MCK8490677.1 hypothetical protein [Spirosoma liriopis]UHG90037.1 hypothetical protein LQ777_17490 [Spirosoma oryzicola]